MNRLAKHEMHLRSFLTMDDMLGAIEGVKHEEVQSLVGDLLDEDRSGAHDARPARPPQFAAGTASTLTRHRGSRS